VKRAAWEALSTLCELGNAAAVIAARDVVREAQGKALLAVTMGWPYPQERVFEVIEIGAAPARMVG
jgi:hypothetical protein